MFRMCLLVSKVESWVSLPGMITWGGRTINTHTHTHTHTHTIVLLAIWEIQTIFFLKCTQYINQLENADRSKGTTGVSLINILFTEMKETKQE